MNNGWNRIKNMRASIILRKKTKVKWIMLPKLKVIVILSFTENNAFNLCKNDNNIYFIFKWNQLEMFNNKLIQIIINY